MKRALVVGGNRGFGAELVERLRAAAVHVTLVNRKGTGSADRVIASDRKDVAAVRRATDGEKWDVIFDLAGYVAEDADASFELFAGRVRRYVLVSSIAVYRLGRDLVEDDFTPARFVPPKGKPSYAEGKRAVEARFGAAAPFPFVSVRLPYVLGRDDYTKRLEYHVKANLEDRRVFVADRSAAMSVVHASEAATFLHALGEKEGVTGSCNYASASPITHLELMSVIATETGKDPRFASKQGASNTSPYDYGGDKFMSLAKARGLGFTPEPTYGWLPSLVRTVVSELRR